MSNITIQQGFEGAKLKIKRAKLHIGELQQAIEGIKRIEVRTLIERIDSEGAYCLGYPRLGRLAVELALPLGDAIHNLRSALDHIWSTLGRAAYPEKKSLLTFPFHETRQNLKDTVEKSPVAVAFPKVKELILDEIKPHSDHGGNKKLWTITKLDKLDKHNLLIPIIDITHISELVFKAGDQTFKLDQGDFVGCFEVFRSFAPIEYVNKPVFTFEVALPEDQPLARDPIIPTVLAMTEATEITLEIFSKTFL